MSEIVNYLVEYAVFLIKVLSVAAAFVVSVVIIKSLSGSLENRAQVPIVMTNLRDKWLKESLKCCLLLKIKSV